MLTRQSKKQKEYFLKLKSDTMDFITNFKKRYELFPWSRINKLKKIGARSNISIKINGVPFTVLSLSQEINKMNNKIKMRLKPTYYNFILKAYIRDSKGLDDSQITEIYNVYKEQLDANFKETKQDLIFCLEALKELNKVLKIKNNDKYTNDTSDVIIDTTKTESTDDENLKNTLFKDFKKYVNENNNVFNKVKVLNEPIIRYQKKKNENWLLLATYDIGSKHETTKLLSKLSDNVKYGGEKIEYDTCYLPGDVFIFVKLPNNDKSMFIESYIGNKYDTVIFDFGSVLIKALSTKDIYKSTSKAWANREISKKDLGILVDTYYNNICDVKYDTVDTDVLKKVYISLLPERLKKYADEVYNIASTSNQQFDYTEVMLKYLKESGYKLYYLSNWGKSSFELSKKKGIFDIIKYFNGGIISYEVGLQKPDKSIYQLLLDKYKIDPKKTIFYDDKKENVESAKKVGINGVLFVKDTVKDIMNLPKVNKSIKDYYKEREEYVMHNNIVDGNAYDINDLMIEATIAIIEEDINDSYIREGTNLDIRAKYKSFKKEYKIKMKEIKDAIKKENYSIALKRAKELKDMLNIVEKSVNNEISTTGSVIFGFFTDWTVSWLRTFALCFVPFIGAPLSAIWSFIDSWGKPIKKNAKSEVLSKDDFNFYKNNVESRLKYMNSCIDKLIKKIENEAMTNKKRQIMESVNGSIMLNKLKIRSSNNVGVIGFGKTPTTLNEFIIESAIEIVDDNADDLMTEGTNLNIRTKYKPLKKEYKNKMNEIKYNLQINEYDKALRGAKDLKVMVKKLKTSIKKEESTIGSVVFGFFTSWTVTWLRTFSLFFVPFIGEKIAFVWNTIDKWGKPIKKIANSEVLSKDDFNFYKNATEACVQTMEISVDNLIKNIESMKLEYKKAESQIEKDDDVKESSLFNTINWYDYISENGDYEDLRDFVIECYESVVDSDINIMTEGADKDIKKIYKDMKAQYKDLLKSSKNNYRGKRFREAVSDLDHASSLVDIAIKKINETDITSKDTIVSWFNLIIWYIEVFVSSVPAFNFPAIISVLKQNVKQMSELAKSSKRNDITVSDFNLTKNKFITKTREFKESIKALQKKIGNDKKEYDNVKNVMDDDSKEEVAEESTREYMRQKRALYEACHNGEITIDEREELFKSLNDQFYLDKNTSDITASSGISNREKFNKVKETLYDRCNRGEISVDEREALIHKAYEMIFTEDNNNDNNGISDKDITNVQKNVSKENEATKRKFDSEIDSM